MSSGWLQDATTPAPGAALNLGVASPPAANPYGAPAYDPYGQQPPHPGFLNAAFAGATGRDPYSQQPAMMPPSDTEILMTMLNTSVPIERFMQTPMFRSLLEVSQLLTTYSIIRIFKNATFDFDEDEGIFKMNMTSLPEDLQTMSEENIISPLNSLSASVNTEISNNDAERAGIIQRSQSSMLQNQLTNALADPGMIANMGDGAGTFLNRLIMNR
tara:strand:+ start:2207 stop:2851 length:645 start_codon:yes stop_codon:yes gene_type:complete